MAPVLTSAHDCSDGGLAVALSELALWSGAGAGVTRLDDAVPLREIGVVRGDRLLGVTLDRLRAAHEGGER